MDDTNEISLNYKVTVLVSSERQNGVRWTVRRQLYQDSIIRNEMSMMVTLLMIHQNGKFQHHHHHY
jgi:hypothetical protein